MTDRNGEVTLLEGECKPRFDCTVCSIDCTVEPLVYDESSGTHTLDQWK